MKKIFTNIAIAILFIGIFIPSSNVNAQQVTNPGPGDIGTCTYPGPNQQPTPNLPYKTCTDGGGTWTANPPSSQTQPTPEQKADDGGWSLSNAFFGGINDFVSGIFYGILMMMSWIVWFAGTLLNYVLDFTIVNMQKNISGLTGINVAWKIIRDLMNIVFIFLLVYEGIKLIIDQGDLKSLKNFIFGVVLASLLINFSLFFTKVLIDASNVVTLGIYTSITGPNGSAINSGLSTPITNALGVSSIYGDKAPPDIFTGRNMGKKLVMLFGSGIVILVSAFAFFAIAIMFIIRFIALVLLMMTSPIAYMGMAIPAMNSYSKEWWESLKGQLLFAPVFMVMILISITLMSSPGFIVEKDFASLMDTSEKPDFSTMGLMLNFTVIIGLIFGSIIVSKKTAASGSKYIGSATKNLTSFAGGAVFGGAARLSRNTLGRFGNSYANNQELLDRAARGDKFARAQLAVANKAATSTFDARGSSAFGKIASGAGMEKDFGKADDSKKQNFRKIREEQIKKDVDDAKKYKPNDAAVDEAKARLNSQEFKDAEEKRARERKEYLESEAYLKSDEKKKETGMEESNRKDAIALRDNDIKIKSSEDSIKKLKEDERNQAEYIKKQMEMGLLNGDELKIQEKKSSEIKEKIRRKEQELELQEMQKKNLAEFIAKREIELKNIAHEKENYMSEEKKKLIALAGGQKTKDDNGKVRKNSEGKIVDQFGNVVNENKVIENSYSQRLEARAKREEAGPAWRWSANIIGTPLSAVIPMKPKTKADRSETARQIRKLKSGKTPEQEAAEAFSKLKKAAEAKGDRTYTTEEESAPGPVAPEAKPAEETPPTA